MLSPLLSLHHLSLSFPFTLSLFHFLPYLSFLGLQNAKTAIEGVYIHNPQAHHQSMQSSDYSKDPLNTNTITAAVEHLHDIMTSVRSIFPDVEWHLRWQKLARR